MPINDGFDTNHALPQFLSRHAEDIGHADERDLQGMPEILKESGFKASIFAVTMAVGGIAIALSLGHPVKVLADATASLIDSSALQGGANRSGAAILSAANARAIEAPNAQPSMPAPDSEMAALPEPADQAQTRSNEASSGMLLMQFEAWAAKRDAEAQEPAQSAVESAEQEPVRPPVETAPAQFADSDPAPVEPVQRHHKAKSVQNARAEIRHVQKPKARLQQEQVASRLAPSIRDARAQEQQPTQTAEPPSFMQSLGWHQ
jgi:hypothetical protein